MLMMQYSSGLSRYEVRKAQLVNQPATGITKIRLAIRPTLLLVMGIVAVSAGVGGVLPAVGSALALLVLVSFLAVFVQRWGRMFDNGAQAVMVVRDGLLRPCAVADLVVGDTLMLAAGQILPVDVQGRDVSANPDAFTALLCRWFDLAVPAGVVVAGSKLQADAQVQVVAVGNQRFVLRQLMPLLTSDWQLSRHLGAQLIQLVIGWIAALRQQVVGVSQALKPRTADQDLVQVAENTQITLVDNNRQAAKENAFRYNQDPVSWPGR